MYICIYMCIFIYKYNIYIYIYNCRRVAASRVVGCRDATPQTSACPSCFKRRGVMTEQMCVCVCVCVCLCVYQIKSNHKR